MTKSQQRKEKCCIFREMFSVVSSFSKHQYVGDTQGTGV